MDSTLARAALLSLASALLTPAAPAQDDELLIVERREDLAGRSRLLGKLQKLRVTVDFTKATARDVAEYLQAATGNSVHFIVSNKTATAGIAEFDLKLVEASLATVMSVIQAQTDLRFTWRAGMVFVKAKDEVKELAFLRMYDVRAAVMPVPNFRAPRLGLHPPGEEAAAAEEEEATPALGYDTDRLIDVVKNNAATESWDREGISIDALRGVLFVRQTVRGHREVEDVLQKVGAIPPPLRIVVPSRPRR